MPKRTRATSKLNGDALRAIRERSGVKVTDLAKQAGITQGHLSNLELGTRAASPETAARIAKALQVPVTAILAHADAAPGDNDDPETSPAAPVAAVPAAS